jgi:hypothetical protein
MKEQDIQLIIEMLVKAEADRKAWQEEMAAWQEKTDADRKAWQEEMAAERRAIEARTEAIKARMKAMRDNMGASHMEMVAEIKPEMDAEMMAYQEMEPCPEEEPTSVDMKPEVAQNEKLPVEVATVMPVVEPEEETSNTRKETMACQEIEARQEEEEPTSVDRKPEVAQQREVPVEDAVLKPVKGRKKRHKGKKKAAE